MDESVNKYHLSLNTILSIPAVRQIIFFAGLATSIALGVYLFKSIQEPVYHPMNYQVSNRNMSAIVGTLDKAGIQYKINSDDGMLYVAASDVQKAKLKLAIAGIARDDSISFSYLNEQGNIGNSQFLENARYVRALENDLSKTIAGIEGVINARVHIAIPQSNVFADENQHPSASIVVTLSPGLSADQEKIRAIINIVANSVPGLDAKFVSITDQSGHFLSGALNEESIFSTQQLHYQNNLQAYYEKRIESMITPLIGDNSVNVRVYANLDFTQNEEANEKYDPLQSVVRSEQSINQTDSSQGASGAPGSLSNTPQDADQSKSASGGANSGRTENLKNYEVSKTVTYRKTYAPKLLNLSVAVVIDSETTMDPKTNKPVKKDLDKETMDKIIQLVKTTVGFNEQRGDKVTVINSSFNALESNIKPDKISIFSEPWFWDTAKKTITIVMGLVVFYISIRKLLAYIKTSQKDMHAGGGSIDPSTGSRISSEMQQLKQEQINRLKELASRDPNRVSVVIKSWIDK